MAYEWWQWLLIVAVGAFCLTAAFVVTTTQAANVYCRIMEARSPWLGLLVKWVQGAEISRTKDGTVIRGPKAKAETETGD